MIVVRRVSLALVTAVLLLAATTAHAQGAKAPALSAIKSYEAGVNAVKAKKWAEAITALNAAIQVDGQPRTYKEGSFDNPYFPQFYLFVAYASSGDMAKASTYAGARNGVPAKVSNDFTQVSTEFAKWQTANIDAAKNAQAFDNFVKQGDAALGQKTSDPKSFDPAITAYTSAVALTGIDDSKKRPVEQKLTDAKNQKDAATRLLASNSQKLTDFNAAVTKGNSALGNKQWADAISQFNSAKALLPDEFTKQNIQSKIEEANNGRNAEQAARTDFNGMVQRGNSAYTAKNWAGAIKEFTDARVKLPADFQSQGLQAKLDEATKQKSDKDFFDNAVQTADRAMASKSYADAKTSYQAAKDRNPTEFASNKLQAKLDLATTEFNKMDGAARAAALEAAKKTEIDSMVRSANTAFGNRKWADAISSYNSLKSKYPTEFGQQNLQARLDEATKNKTLADSAPLPPGPVNADNLLRDGLRALYEDGNAAKAVSLLKQANDNAGKLSKAGMKVTAAAFLSVAIASQAIQTNSESMKQDARQQFKAALQIQKGYKLDDKLVSPQVRDLLTKSN